MPADLDPTDLQADGQLLASAPPLPLIADLVDRAADDQAEWLESGVLDEQMLVDGEVRREQAVPVLGQSRVSARRPSRSGRPRRPR